MVKIKQFLVVISPVDKIKQFLVVISPVDKIKQFFCGYYPMVNFTFTSDDQIFSTPQRMLARRDPAWLKFVNC